MLALFSMIQQGGILMIPLAACSFTAVFIIIERAIALRRRAVEDENLVRAVHEYDERTADQLMLACRRSHSPLAHILLAILRARHLDHAHLLESMNTAGRAQLRKLERGLVVLEIIGVTSPLLGLLGTVVGMVDVFNAITIQGLGNPQVLSGGIAKALITTVAGLVVAIPAVAAHSWFSKRVDDFSAEFQDAGAAFITRIVEGRGARHSG